MSGSRWLRLILVIMVLLVVVWLVDIERTWAILKGAEFRWLGIAFLVVQLQMVLSAYRWQQTAHRLAQPLRLQRAISEYYLATLANLSLPGGVGGDAARVYRNRDSRGWEPAVMSVTLERLAGQVALIAVTLAGWLLWPVFSEQQAPAGVLHVLILVALIIVVAVGLLFVLATLSRRIQRFTRNIGPAIRAVWVTDYQWVLQTLLSLAIVATYITVFAISAKSLSQPIPTMALVTIVPVVLLSMVLPVSIGGWGIRELTAAALWPVIGLSAEAGTATSIVYGLVSLLFVLPGAVVCVFFMSRIDSGYVRSKGGSSVEPYNID